MKKLISVLMAVLLISLQGITAMADGDDVFFDMETNSMITITISDMENQYKTQGRTSVVGSLLMLDYSASSFEFNANCKGDVLVKLNAQSLSGGSCYFTAYVDGVKSEREAFVVNQTGTVTLKIAEGLEPGDHSFRLVRQTEIERAKIGIASVELDGKLIAPAKNKNLYIEFVGDSNTTAYGNLANNTTQNSQNAPFQDATQGYAFLTAEELNADYSIVARQGIGASVGYQPVSMNTVYPLLRHCYDGTTSYDFARAANIVVICLGSNDTAKYDGTNVTADDIKQGFADMLKLIREKNPGTKVVWIHKYKSKLNYGALVDEVIAEAGGAAEGLYSYRAAFDEAGGNGHPSVAGHIAVANELVDFIKTNGLDIVSTNYTVSDMQGRYKTQGRATVVDNMLMLDWSGSAFEFNADCEGDVFVTLNTKSVAAEGCYFTVYVDGVKSKRDAFIVKNKGLTKLKIAENLPKGNHSFKIVRQTEIEHAHLGIQSVEMIGTFLEAPKPKDLYIEFVGASTTAGYGNLGDSTTGDAAARPTYQDVTQAYSYMTAEALGADYSIIARQGTGATVGYQPSSMNKVYPLVRECWDKTTHYNFERTADIVVIGLGTNDANTYNKPAYAGRDDMTLADVEAGFVEMLEIIREKNPNAKIVWMYNMMTSKVNSEVQNAVKTAGGAEKGFYALKVTQNTSGGRNHPSLEGHKTFTNELTEFIRNKLGIKTAEFLGNGIRLTGKPALRFRYKLLKSAFAENALGDNETLIKFGFAAVREKNVSDSDFTLETYKVVDGVAYDKEKSVNIISEQDESSVTYQAALYNIGVLNGEAKTDYNYLGHNFLVRPYYVLEKEDGSRRTVYEKAISCSFFDVVKAIEEVGTGDDFNALFGAEGYMNSDLLDTVSGQTVLSAYNKFKK